MHRLRIKFFSSLALPTSSEVLSFRRWRFPHCRKHILFVVGTSHIGGSVFFSSLVLPILTEALSFRRWCFPHCRKRYLFVFGASHIGGSIFFSLLKLPTLADAFSFHRWYFPHWRKFFSFRRWCFQHWRKVFLLVAKVVANATAYYNNTLDNITLRVVQRRLWQPMGGCRRCEKQGHEGESQE